MLVGPKQGARNFRRPRPPPPRTHPPRPPPTPAPPLRSQYLSALKDAENATLPLELLPRDKTDKNKANYAALVAALRSSHSSKVVATLGKEKPIGDLATGWRAALAAEADLAQVELGPALAELLVVKEDKEVSCVKRAAISAVVMQKSLVKRIEDCIEEDKKEKHSILADETEKAFEDPAKLGVKLAADLLESCYTPIIQSGGVFDLKPSAQSSDEKLHYGTITCSLGAVQVVLRQRQPHPHHQPVEGAGAQLQALLGSSRCRRPPRRCRPRRPPPPASPLSPPPPLLPQAALDAMRADAKLSSVHEAVVNRLKSKAPHLESKLTRNCGFATGLEFKEARTSSTPSRSRGCGRGWRSTSRSASRSSRRRTPADAKGKTCAAPRIHPAQPFPRRAARPTPPTTHPHLPPPRRYALFLADTVLITESGAPSCSPSARPKRGPTSTTSSTTRRATRTPAAPVVQRQTDGQGRDQGVAHAERGARRQQARRDERAPRGAPGGARGPDAYRRAEAAQEHGDPTAGTSGARETALAYRDPNAYPTATTSSVLKLNQTHVDGKAETVLVPVNGRSSPSTSPRSRTS